MLINATVIVPTFSSLESEKTIEYPTDLSNGIDNIETTVLSAIPQVNSAMSNQTPIIKTKNLLPALEEESDIIEQENNSSEKSKTKEALRTFPSVPYESTKNKCTAN